MKIRRLSIQKADLLKMSSAERAFFLLCGHMHNETTSLNKVFAWCLSQSPTTSTVENVVDGAQALIYAKLLAGKLNEGWELIQKAYFRTKLSQEFGGQLPPRTEECLKELKRYFSKSNTLNLVRNSFSFHYSVEPFLNDWESAASGPGFDLFVGGEYGNTFHQASEMVANLGLLNAIGAGDIASSLSKFFEELNAITGLFSEFVSGIMFVILRKHLGPDFGRLGVEESLIPEHAFAEVRIPFFYIPPRKQDDVA